MKRDLAVVVFLGALCFSGCSSHSAVTEGPAAKTEKAADQITLTPEQESAAMIETRRATLTRQADLLQVKGKIALADDQTFRVGVRTVGLVVAVYANLGDAVHKGQVLARYHADEVRDSRAQYRTAMAELDRAKTAETQAQRNRDRAQRMLELKAGSRQQVEMMEQDLVNARAALHNAQIEGDRGRDLLEDDLRVPAEPNANRKDDLEDDVPILAPGDGFVLEKNVTPGKTVELSTVTFVIGDLSKVWMLASVRQDDLGKLHVGQAASVTLPGTDRLRFLGKITNLGQQFDPETRVMQVRIELTNPGGRLRPEMLADAEIAVGTGKAVLLVPSDSVQQINGSNVVFLRAAPRQYVMRTVQVGDTRDGNTIVTQGIEAGDEVVGRGSFILKSQLLRSTLESE